MKPVLDRSHNYDRAGLLRELAFEAVRSSGPGGQAVNKKSTKERLRWRPADSRAFNSVDRERLMSALAPRLTKGGDLVLASDQFRERLQNRRFVTELFFSLVDDALLVPEERIATKPTRASRARRVEVKMRQAKKKAERRKGWD